MARLQALFYLAIFITLVFSSPLKQHKKRSFKVKRVEVPNYRPNGPKAYKRALLKFGFDDISFVPGGEVASRIKAATAASISSGEEDGETPAAPTQNDAQFLSPVNVGGQTLIMNFDSGSSDTWVFNTNLPAQAQQGHTIYDPTQSSTFQLLEGSTFNITYGDSSFASGPVGVDTVDIGGSTVDQQAIGIPDVVADSFVTDSASNGLVGLAFSQLNTIEPQQQQTFFANVITDLSQPVFTAQLKGGEVGAYEFGRIDTTAFTGDLATVPVDSSRGFWEVDSAAAAVNGQNISIPNGKAIVDTGTSLMLVTDEMLIGYWNQVPDAQLSQDVGGVIFPCNSQLPDLQVAIGDSYMATIPGEGLNFSAVGKDNTGTDCKMMLPPKRCSLTIILVCFGGLQSNQGLGFSIYGDVFFKSQFVVFDGSGPSVGIAPHS